MTEIERLMERAEKDLADLRKVIDRMRAILSEYGETIDTLAREREAQQEYAETIDSLARDREAIQKDKE